jgi:hypothetical protein
MGSAGIRLETRSPNYVMYLLAIIGDVWMGSSDLPGKGPRVVAINDKGEEIVMEQYESMRLARGALPDMEGELQEMGQAAWCEKYDMPASFCPS